MSSSIRLNRFISECTGISRRKADELIAAGKVKVNGKPAVTGQQVNPIKDTIIYKGQKLEPVRKLYIMMNKPKGYITTRSDPEERKTVYDLLPEAFQTLDPVGRLDRNSTGLLLFSNDGDFIQRLTHPKYKHRKIYRVRVDKPLTKANLKKLQDGIRLMPEDQLAQFNVRQVADQVTVVLETQTGLNRQIRRSFEAMGYEVRSLKRTAIDNLQLGPLPLGKLRSLKLSELRLFMPTPPQSNRSRVKSRPAASDSPRASRTGTTRRTKSSTDSAASPERGRPGKTRTDKPTERGRPTKSRTDKPTESARPTRGRADKPTESGRPTKTRTDKTTDRAKPGKSTIGKTLSKLASRADKPASSQTPAKQSSRTENSAVGKRTSKPGSRSAKPGGRKPRSGKPSRPR